jgi:hypothetical protein
VCGHVEAVVDPADIGVLRIHDLLAIVPAVVVNMDPEWIAVGAEFVDEPLVAINHEVGPPVSARYFRVESKKPCGMTDHTGAVCKPRTQFSYEFRHSDEAAPGPRRGWEGKFIRLYVDAPNRWNRAHVLRLLIRGE